MPVTEPHKSKWLQEVEDDAVRITERRFREQEEERQYQVSKKETKVQAPVVEEPETPEVVEETPEVEAPAAKPVEKKGKK